jgi:uncharacterized protein
MPGGWPKPREIAKLADSRAEFEFAIPVAELPGIPAELSLADEPVRVKLRFEREQGTPIAEVNIRATLRPLCQRCLAPMNLQIAADSRVAVVESEAAADRVPGEMETFLAPEGRCDLVLLAAEELLLALPIVPRHAPGEPCVPAAEIADEALVPAMDAGAPVETQRPFADLRALLERDKS